MPIILNLSQYIRVLERESCALLQQIDKGAPVDVFASAADQKTMDEAKDKRLILLDSRKPREDKHPTFTSSPFNPKSS